MKILLKVFLPVLFVILAAKPVFAQDDAMIAAGIKKVYDMFNTGDMSKLSEFVDDNFVEHSPMPGQKPGLSGLVEAIEMMKKGYPDMKMTIKDITVDCTNNKAAVLYTMTGTNTGEMMGMPPTNKKIEVLGIDYLLFKDGKATEHWGYFDMETMMKQLGMMPEGDMNKDK
jgi:steroid delta-isomerase-like uncharacterized protein